MIEDTDLGQIAEPLLAWFGCHARVLPWREEPSAYRVWVSEIMLQQTRVEAVKPYFERFIKALPDLASLAACPEDELLKLWEGLGYYNRVRNMQTAAKAVMEEYGGRFPSDYDELLKLKGIGHYTAGAVASIAFEKPVPAVDGNVLRVLMRISADDSDIMKQSVKNKVEEAVRAVIPKDRPGAFNQALMELGAVVCLPNGAPLCGKCPCNDLCKAKAQGRIPELPVKSRAKARRIEERTVMVIRDGERVALKKRPGKGLLAGMYELPNAAGRLSEREALGYVEEMGLHPLRIEKLGEARHIFSHVEWHMSGYIIRVDEFTVGESGMLFAEQEDVERRYPIPAAFEAYVKYMSIRLGNERFYQT